MKNRGQKIGLTIVAMVLLAILAFIFYETFFDFVLRQFRDAAISVTSTTLLGQFSELYTFMSVISMLPALFLFAHFVLKDQKPSVFLFIIPITLLCGVALMYLHIYSLRMEASKINEMMPSFIENSISLSSIHAARYLGIGFILGAVFSTATLSFVSRNRNS